MLRLWFLWARLVWCLHLILHACDLNNIGLKFTHRYEQDLLRVAKDISSELFSFFPLYLLSIHHLTAYIFPSSIYSFLSSFYSFVSCLVLFLPLGFFFFSFCFVLLFLKIYFVLLLNPQVWDFPKVGDSNNLCLNFVYDFILFYHLKSHWPQNWLTDTIYEYPYNKRQLHEFLASLLVCIRNMK